MLDTLRTTADLPLDMQYVPEHAAPSTLNTQKPVVPPSGQTMIGRRPTTLA